MLRGARFAFHETADRTSGPRFSEQLFAASSVITPFFMGTVVGAVASGRVPVGDAEGDPWSSWLNPTSILGGILAVCLTAYLSAFFLVFDAGRLADEPMVAYFRTRAWAAGIAAGLVAAIPTFVLHDDATYLFDGLTSRALPLVILSALSGITAP